jgi:hypothetical protein
MSLTQALIKLAISEEDLTRIARQAKHKFHAPKSLSKKPSMALPGPLSGVGHKKARRMTKSFADFTGGDARFNPKDTAQALTTIGASPAAAETLAGKRKVIVPGYRAGTSKELLGQLRTLGAPPKMSGKGKELLSKVFWAHEGAEHAAKKYRVGTSGHMNPGVLVKETNILNTLKSDPKAIKEVKGTLGAIRQHEPLTRVKYTVAGTPFEWTWGKGARNLTTGEALPRVSRHHRKAINNAAGGMATKAVASSRLPEARAEAMGSSLRRTVSGATKPAKLKKVLGGTRSSVRKVLGIVSKGIRKKLIKV